MRHPEDALSEKLFSEEMQCSHVGLHTSEPGVIGCMLYDVPELEEDVGSFFTGTCKNFYCPAWHDLTDRQVLFAALLMGDWYYYSLLINDIEAVHAICAEYGRPEDVPPDALLDLKAEIEERFLEEDGK